MEYVVIWIALGIVAAIIAANKGRSVAGWFFIGLLLGPIGVLIAFVVPKNQGQLERAALATGDMKRCPYCAELVKAEAKVCKHCGSDLSAESLERNFKDASAKEKLRKIGITEISRADPGGIYPMMRYAAEGNQEIVGLLLDAGASKQDTDMAGQTAADKARSAGHHELADFIDNY